MGNCLNVLNTVKPFNVAAQAFTILYDANISWLLIWLFGDIICWSVNLAVL